MADPAGPISDSSSSYSPEEDSLFSSGIRGGSGLEPLLALVLDGGSGYTHSRDPFLHPIPEKPD